MRGMKRRRRLIHFSGSAAGDVAIGVVLLILSVAVASIGLLLPVVPALVWFAACVLAFVALHLRRGSHGRRGRAAAIVRLRPPGPALKWVVLAGLPMIVFGLAVGGLLQLWTGAIHSPVAPSGPNQLEELASTRSGWLVLTAYAVVMGPLIEEFCFRGWIQRPLERTLGPASAIFCSALAFAVVHAWYGHVGFLVMPFAMGVVWGSAVYLTGSIWTGVALHGIWNGVLMVVVGLVTDPGAIFVLPESSAGVIALSLAAVGGLLALVWIGGQVGDRGRVRRTTHTHPPGGRSN